MSKEQNALDISEVEDFTLEKMLMIPQEDAAYGGKMRYQRFKRLCPLTLQTRSYSITLSGLEEKQNHDNMPELFKVKMKILKDKIQEESDPKTYLKTT